MSDNRGGGHWEDLQASARTCWSGMLVCTEIVSPGNNICLVFKVTSGCLSPWFGWCILTGNLASLVVARTVLLSLRRDIVLLIMSCFIPFSLIKSVPPIARLCSLWHTRASKVSGVMSL